MLGCGRAQALWMRPIAGAGAPSSHNGRERWIWLVNAEGARAPNELRTVPAYLAVFGPVLLRFRDETDAQLLPADLNDSHSETDRALL